MQKFAHFISNIFQPFLIPTYSMLLLFQTEAYSTTNLYYKLYTILGIFVLTCVLPIVCLAILKKIGLISSMMLENRKERTIPYIFALLCYISTIIFLWRIYMPTYIVAMMFSSVLSTIFIMLINFKWKISAHLCAMGNLCGYIFIVNSRLGIASPWILAAAFIIAGLVATARMILGVHTPLQTLLGYILGLTLVTFFGSLNLNF